MEHTITQRSKLQAEALVSYHFTRDIEDAANTQIETYMFVPRHLGINPRTYPKHLFYRDLQTLSELDLKALSLAELAAAGGEAFGRLRAARDRLLQNPEQATEASVAHRIFCKALSNAIDARCALVDAEPDAERQRQLAADYLTHCQALCRNFRALMPQDSSLAGTYRPIVDVCDEHISLHVEQASCRLLDTLGSLVNAAETSPEGGLLALAQGEAAYRMARGYPSVPSTRRHAEELVHRRDTLDQHIDSALYLSAHDKQEGRFLRELFLSVAAGLAMIFATSVAFLAHIHYENWTSTFFVILVISYMLKDRIKAQSQAYFTQHSQRYLFDYKTLIYNATGGKPIGYKRETFEFLTPNSLDPEVERLRNRYLPGQGAEQQGEERVLRYKRRIGFYARRFGQDYAGFALSGLRNHVRFDLSRLTQKMEDTKTAVYLPHGGGYREIAGRRVTHLHLVVKTCHPRETTLRHLRLTLTRGGIKRIEELPV